MAFGTPLSSTPLYNTTSRVAIFRPSTSTSIPPRTFRFSPVAVTPDELGATLRKIAELYPDQAVILRGDEGADYRHIVAVLDVCRGANIWNVAFATGRVES